jgi:hypothetical protein
VDIGTPIDLEGYDGLAVEFIVLYADSEGWSNAVLGGIEYTSSRSGG